MNQARTRSLSLLFQLGGLVLAFLFVTLILLLVGADPFEAFRLIISGAAGTLRG